MSDLTTYEQACHGLMAALVEEAASRHRLVELGRTVEQNTEILSTGAITTTRVVRFVEAYQAANDAVREALAVVMVTQGRPKR